MLRIPRWLIIVLVLLLAIRIVLPTAALYGINWALNEKLTAYEGSLEDVDLALYRGAYVLEGLRLQKKNLPEEVPDLLSIARMDISIAWRELIRGRIAADVEITEPVVHLSDHQMDQKKQLGKEEKNWRETLDVLLPIDLERFAIRSGQLEFFHQGFSTDKPIKISSLNITAKNIKSQEAGLSPFNLDATIQEHASFVASGKLDALSETPSFDLDFRLEDLKMVSVNQALMKYVPVNITRGLLSIYGEVISGEKAADGYAKFFLKDPDILAPQQDYKGGKHLLVELATGFANLFLENEDKETIALRLPFSKKGDKWDFGVQQAIDTALENREDPLEPKIDHLLSIEARN